MTSFEDSLAIDYAVSFFAKKLEQDPDDIYDAYRSKPSNIPLLHDDYCLQRLFFFSTSAVASVSIAAACLYRSWEAAVSAAPFAITAFLAMKGMEHTLEKVFNTVSLHKQQQEERQGLYRAQHDTPAPQPT